MRATTSLIRSLHTYIIDTLIPVADSTISWSGTVIATTRSVAISLAARDAPSRSAPRDMHTLLSRLSRMGPPRCCGTCRALLSLRSALVRPPLRRPPDIFNHRHQTRREFNLRLARSLKAPAGTVQYVSPQVWAWAGRVRTIGRRCDWCGLLPSRRVLRAARCRRCSWASARDQIPLTVDSRCRAARARYPGDARCGVLPAAA